MEVVIAGGGVAGLEALLGLRTLAGERVGLTLVAPDPVFTYRPLSVAEPFGLGRAHRVPLAQIVADARAELVEDAVVAVDDAGGSVRLRSGAARSFDALVVAPGGRAVAGVDGATTWWPDRASDELRGLLRDIEDGHTGTLAIVVPVGATWPLPAYELALMTMSEARARGRSAFRMVVVTPEPSALAMLGRSASETVAEELAAAGIGLETGAVAFAEGDGVRLQPGGRWLEADRILAVPRIVGPAIAGLPTDEDGFILAGDDARVQGCRRTWAAGDGVASPAKFGGLATHQARRSAAAIARAVGVHAPDPGEPVLTGRLLVGGRTRRLLAEGQGRPAPLWWPTGKIAGVHLPCWLMEHGVVPSGSDEPPTGEGIPIRRPLKAMRGAEAQYLYDLSRHFRGGRAVA